MRIRPYVPSDAPAIVDLFKRTVEAIGPRDYSAAQVRAWSDRTPDLVQVRARCSDGRVVLVAVDDQDTVMAYGDLEGDGHLDHLYCAPEYVGQGVASTLYNALENVARDQNIARIFVEASEAAKRLFAAKGYNVTRKREFEIGGVPMHNYAMEKHLS